MELDLGVNSEWAKNGNFSDRFSLPQIELTELSWLLNGQKKGCLSRHALFC